MCKIRYQRPFDRVIATNLFIYLFNVYPHHQIMKSANTEIQVTDVERTSKDMFVWTTVYIHYLLYISLLDIGGCEKYLWLEEVCVIPQSFDSTNIYVSGVTRQICRRLCSQNYDLLCSGFLFNRSDSSCTLTAYTGEWIEINSNASCSPTDRLEFYRRQRCVGRKNNHIPTPQLPQGIVQFCYV